MYTEQQPTTIPAAIPQMAHEFQTPNIVSWTVEQGSQGNIQPPLQPAPNRHAQGEPQPIPISTYSSIAMALDFSEPRPQAAAQGSSQRVDTPLHSNQQYSSGDGLIAESANQFQALGHETSTVVPGTTDEIPMSLTLGRSTGNPGIPTASTGSHHSFTPLPAGEQISNTNRGDTASRLQLSPPVAPSTFTFTTPMVRDVPEIASQTAGNVRMNGPEKDAQAVHKEWELIEEELAEGRNVSLHDRKYIKSWDCYERVTASLLRCQETNCPSRQPFSCCSTLRRHVKNHFTVRCENGETAASHEDRVAVAKAEGEAKVKEDKYIAAMEKFRSLADLARVVQHPPEGFVMYEPT